MRRGPSGQRIAVLVVLLTVTAGCQTLAGTAPAAERTATEQLRTETTPTASDPPADGNETGIERTRDNGSANETRDIFDTHERTLRRLGSATVERSWARLSFNRSTGEPIPFRQFKTDTTTRVDFDRGRLYETTQSSLGETAVTYRNESGATFILYGGGGLSGPRQTDRSALNASLDLFSADVEQLDRRPDTNGNTTGTVYVLDSYEELNDTAASADPANVTAFTATYVVDERGYIAHARLNYTIERGDSKTIVTSSVRVTGAGSTTVERPEWAKEESVRAGR